MYDLGMQTTTEYATRVGLVLRTARYVREMTREEVAAGCGVNFETIARWERANVTIPGHALSRLAEVLRLPADLLLDPPTTRSGVLVRMAAHDAMRPRLVEPQPGS